MEEEENEKQERIHYLNKRFPRVFKARLHLSLARMYFVKV